MKNAKKEKTAPCPLCEAARRFTPAQRDELMARLAPGTEAVLAALRSRGFDVMEQGVSVQPSLLYLVWALSDAYHDAPKFATRVSSLGEPAP